MHTFSNSILELYVVGVVQLAEHLIVVQDVAGSSPVSHPNAPLAQLAEQRTLNPWVPGSSPGGRTTYINRCARSSAG